MSIYLTKKSKSGKNHNMKKVLFILQNFLKIFLIFLAVFIWARYLIKNFWLAFLLTIVLTTVIDFVTRFIAKKISKKKSLKIQEKEEAEDLFLSIATQEKPLDFFLKLASYRHKNAVKKKNYILIDHGENGKVALYPFLSFLPLNSNDVAQIANTLQKEGCQKIVVTCGEIDKSAASFSKNFESEFLLMDKFQTYLTLYKEYNIFPEKTLKYKKDKKLALKELVAFSFNRARTKGYLLSAFFLFLSSLIIRPSIYYCIIASMLLIFALISFANPKYNLKTKSEVL